jgi:putative ABC transport system permease protein
VEEGIAKTLGIKLGERLTYDIAGAQVTAPVTSLRSVEWDSFRANFFVVAPPGVLERFPASYITSFYLPADRAGGLDALVKRFPNLTVIDVSAVMDQVRGIIERVSLAVQYVFLFTLAAGLTVLYAAIQSTLDERLHENAVLRALGAKKRRLWWGLAAEFATLGALAGLLAAVLASGLGFALARWVLELDYLGNPWLWLLGLLGGGLGVGLAGTWGARRVVRSPPLVVLRQG